jgi:TP901 family phage tail tape measure protein
MALEEAGLKLVAENESGFVSAMGSATTANNTFVGAVEQGAPKVGGASQVIIGALREVGAAAVNFAMEAGKAVVGFVTDSIGVAGDFEAGMNRFAAATGQPVESLDELRGLFVKLGKELPVSTSEVEDAAIALAKGGLDPATISAGALRTSLDLAASSGIGLESSADILSKQMNTWIDRSSTAADKATFLASAADLLSQAALKGGGSVEEMALGLANVGGSAKAAGVNFDETVKALTLIAPGFSSAADAGTSLKTFFSRMIPTTKEQTAAMVDLGLATADGKSAFFDAEGSFVGMSKAAQMLQNATAGMSEEQRLATLQTIFGQDALRAAAILAEQGAAGYDKLGEAMAGVGSVSEQAKQQQQGFNVASENMKGSLEALQITIGTALIPILSDLLNNVISPAINVVTAFAEAFFSSSDKIGFLKTALDSVLPGASGLITVIQDIIAFVTDLAKSLQEPSDSMTALGDVFSVAGGVISDVVNAIGQVVTAIFGEVAKFIGAHGKEIETFISDAWAMILSIIKGVLKVIDATVVPALKAIAKFIGENGAEIQNLFSNTWTFIQTLIDTVLKVIQGIVTAVLQLINGDTQGALDTLKGIFDTVWNAIKTLVDTVVNQIKTIVNLVLAAMGTDIDKIWQGIKTAIEDVITAIKTGIETQFEAIKKAVTGAIQGALDGISALFNGFVQAGKDLISKIVEGIDHVAGTVGGAIKSAIEGVGDIASKLADFLKGIGSAVIDFIVKGLSDAGSSIFNALKGIIQGAIQSIINFFTGGGGGGDALSTARGASFAGTGTTAAAASGVSYVRSVSYAPVNTRQYSLSVTSTVPQNNLVQQFALMEALS